MTPSPLNYRVTITTGTIVRVIVILLVIYLGYIVRDILALLFVSLIFASAVDPWVDKMQARKIPRALGMFLLYIIIFVFITGTVILIIPPVVEQFIILQKNLPQYVEKLNAGYVFLRDFSQTHGLAERLQTMVNSIEGNLSAAANNAIGWIVGIFGGIFSFFVVLVITYYMAVEEDVVKKIIWSLAPPEQQPYLIQLMSRMQRQIGYWLRGQLILMFVIGFLTWLGLQFLMPQYALALGLIAGVTEFIPYLGPFIGALPAVFLAFSESPFLALIVLIWYIVIQQIEGNIVTPKIMQRAVGLNPIISIAVLMAGMKLAGVVGALLSIPVATALSVVIKDWLRMRNRQTTIG